MSEPTTLQVRSLTAQTFPPFGEVIESNGRPFHHINDGMAERYDDLAEVDVLARGGKVGISLFVARPYAQPLSIRRLERHPLSSEAFLPMAAGRYLVVVALPGEAVVADDVRAFITDGQQGVSIGVACGITSC